MICFPMDHKFHSICQLETRKLLWLVGISFAMVLLLQSIELPRGNVLGSLFSAIKVPIEGDIVDVEESPFISDMSGNKTLSNDSDTTTASTVHEGVDDHGFEERGSVLYNGTLPKSNTVSNESYGVNNYTTGDEKSSIENQVGVNGTTAPIANISIGGYAPEETMVPDSNERLSLNSSTMYSNSSAANKKNNVKIPENDESTVSYIAPSPARAIPPVDSSSNSASSIKEGPHVTISIPSSVSNTSSTEVYWTPTPKQDVKSNQMQGDVSSLSDSSPTASIHDRYKTPQAPTPEVITIAEMNALLLQSRVAYRSMKPQWSSVVDQELLKAKLQIENAPIMSDTSLYAPLYQNVSMFKRSYELMEEMLKVYIYKEGQKPIVHQPVLQGIYASEGWFMKLLEANKKFVTKHARKAHLFYLPFSSRMLEETLYVPNSHSHKNLIQFLRNYLDVIKGKHPFWNRTGGADHFLVACHDWAPSETRRVMARCIRALCNSDVKEGFVFGKDVSLPETYVRSAQKPLRNLGGKRPSRRSILAFFAGNMHGYVRPILLQHWGNKDPDMRIFGPMPNDKGNMNYIQHMRSSKYCICAKGYEVNSPRVVEAIFYECVPVIISDNFVPPFFETLNWESFAVFVLEKDIPNLKNILLSIPEKRYRRMQMRVKKVQQHFLWHSRPVKYDIFHMILHSIWFNRVFQINPR
ncbi:probable glycosyltransferase At5g03795 isoform X2 [Syzygium oleosum]|nr:probable glycosyltransferase At5g03795 isoform X2 [Syzygium oleosum]XP_030452645.1 probable glycosyltransferase At5g03795 isoform X2 [Syzygium oleosum]